MEQLKPFTLILNTYAWLSVWTAYTYLRNCFLSKENLERKNKAKKLSKDYNCSINDIALAWVLHQNFPSYAIIGPKKINQLNFSLNSIKIKLSEKEIKWLNLSS